MVEGEEAAGGVAAEGVEETVSRRSGTCRRAVGTLATIGDEIFFVFVRLQKIVGAKTKERQRRARGAK